MDEMNIFAIENNGVNEEKPPPRMCPRCNSDNTKFCYYNNYSITQPRYFCKNCRRFWTHGGTLRNVPIGGSSRKAKQPNVPIVESNYVSRMVHVPNQQVYHAPPLLGNHFDSSSYAVGNHFGSSSNIHGGMAPNLPMPRTFGPNHHLDYNYGSFGKDYYDTGSGYPLMNQTFDGYDDNYNEYGINQVDQHNWNQKMNHNAQH